MTAWRLYGSLYYREKLQPLVESAYNAALREHNRKIDEGSVAKDAKNPEWVSIWTAVVMDAYEKESDEIKRRVAEAVEAQMDGGIFNPDSLQREGQPSKLET